MFKTCGYFYLDSHTLPGALDYLVASHNGRPILLEVKDPARPAPITAAEKRTLDALPGVAFIVTEPEQARAILLALDEEEG
jgi:hypothetical protein